MRRSTLASALHLLSKASPFGVALAAAFVVGAVLLHPRGADNLTWFVASALVATITFAGTRHLARHGLVLAALLDMHVAFPARPPSRFAVAMRATSAAALEGLLSRYLDVADSAENRASGMAFTAGVGALRSVPPDQSQLILENGEASITKRVTEGDFLGYVQVVTDRTNARQLFGALLTVSVVAALLTTVALSTADTDVREQAQPSRIGTTVPTPAPSPTPSTSNAEPPTTQSGASNAGRPTTTQSGASSATPGAASTVSPATAIPPPVSPGSAEEDVSPPPSDASLGPSGSRVAAAGDTQASGPEPAAVAATTWTARSEDSVAITPAIASAPTPVASATLLAEPGVSVSPVPTLIRAASMLSTVDAPIGDLVVVTATSGIVAAGPDTRAAGTTSAADVILDTTSAAETNTVVDPTGPSGDTTAQNEDPAGSVPVQADAADAPSPPTGEAETAGVGEVAAGSTTTADTSVPGTTATDVGGTESAPGADGSPTELPGSTP